MGRCTGRATVCRAPSTCCSSTAALAGERDRLQTAVLAGLSSLATCRLFRTDAPLRRSDGGAQLYELGGFPAALYSTDVGLGLGVIGNLARVQVGVDPYHWLFRVRALSFLKYGEDGSLGTPFHAYLSDIDIPGLLDGPNMILGHCELVRDCVWSSGDA